MAVDHWHVFVPDPTSVPLPHHAHHDHSNRTQLELTPFQKSVCEVEHCCPRYMGCVVACKQAGHCSSAPLARCLLSEECTRQLFNPNSFAIVSPIRSCLPDHILSLRRLKVPFEVDIAAFHSISVIRRWSVETSRGWRYISEQRV